MADFFVIFILAVFVGIAYLITLFFKRFTKSSKYAKALNILIFIVAFAIILLVAFIIFINTITIRR